MSDLNNLITGQFEVRLPFAYGPDLINIHNADGALYTLENSLADHLGNYSKLVISKPENYSYDDIGFPFGSLYFDGIHSLKTDIGEAGITLQGLTKVNGVDNSDQAKYSVAIQFMLNSLPPEGSYWWILFIGNTDNHFGIKVNPEGGVFYERVSNGVKVTKYEDMFGYCDINTWYSAMIIHNQANSDDCYTYLDGYGIPQPANAKVYADPNALTPFQLGSGPNLIEGQAPYKFDPNKSTSQFQYSYDGLTATYKAGSTGYGCTTLNADFPHTDSGDTNKYYFEVIFHSGTHGIIGLTGRDWEEEFTNGPTNFLCRAFLPDLGREVAIPMSAPVYPPTPWVPVGDPIPVGSVIGILCDNSAKKVSIYVNGEFYAYLGNKYITSLVGGDILPVVISDAEISCEFIGSKTKWRYPPSADCKELITEPSIIKQGNTPPFKGRMRWFRVYKGLMETDEIIALYNRQLYPTINLLQGNKSTDITNLAQKWEYDKNEILMSCPSVPTGDYSFKIDYKTVSSTLTGVHITNFEDLVMSSNFVEDFSNQNSIIQNWYAANKKWGKGNNGVSNDLVSINLSDKILHCKAHGDYYLGGLPRVGSCLVSKKYFTPGRFELRVKFPPYTGVCCALWPFHYEEAYPGFPEYQELISEGFGRQGNPELGYYVVRNNEIDIETPTALMNSSASPTYNYGRFNTWIGELDNEYTPVFQSFFGNNATVSDGNWHNLVIDWQNIVGGVPETSFYIDDQLITSINTHIPDIPMRFWIGAWFPYRWAGFSAPWSEQEFLCSSFSYTSYANPNIRFIPETYPQDGLVNLIQDNFTLIPEPPVETPRVFTVNPQSVTLAESESISLITHLEPENSWTVNYVTSDLTIAEVDANGKITGVNRGNTEITATCGEGIQRVSVRVISSHNLHRMSTTIALRGVANINLSVSNTSSYVCSNYLDLVTSEHKKPKFLKFLESIACPMVSLAETLNRIIQKFDVDTASGDQLDIIGEWVGANRVMAVNPDEANIFFSFNIVGAGWDYAYWYDGTDPNAGLSKVPDKVYRMLVKAKIAANMWDGSSMEANTLWGEVFSGSRIYFFDNLDMTMGVYISGLSIDSIIYELIVNGYLAIKPEGVRISYYIIGPDDPQTKLFAWGSESEIIGGWSAGHWAQGARPIEDTIDFTAYRAMLNNEVL